eukprot:757128-Hanusia_phi.AAC.1
MEERSNFVSGQDVCELIAWGFWGKLRKDLRREDEDQVGAGVMRVDLLRVQTAGDKHVETAGSRERSQVSAKTRGERAVEIGVMKSCCHLARDDSEEQTFLP